MYRATHYIQVLQVAGTKWKFVSFTAQVLKVCRTPSSTACIDAQQITE